MVYHHTFSDPTANSLLRVSKSTAVEAGGVFCLINQRLFNDLRHALLFLQSVPTSWKSSVETISVNYLNTRYAHDVFEALRGLPNLRYLRIALGFHHDNPCCECIRSTDAKGFWALRNLRRIELVFAGSRYEIEPGLRQLLKRETSWKTPIIRDITWDRQNAKYTKRGSQVRLDIMSRRRRRSLRSRSS